ncbi:MAG: hypothetical protein P9M08_01920 [Candidatus Erginobacter occultus]|jgi:hypothetical protein|nr:hypothetical protein [Candidatus Erginobacter occultus]
MKKVNGSNGELRPEYDFSAMTGGVRGKYAARYRAGTNLVKIDPDVAEVFADESAANEAPRPLIRGARRRTGSVS